MKRSVWLLGARIVTAIAARGSVVFSVCFLNKAAGVLRHPDSGAALALRFPIIRL